MLYSKLNEYLGAIWCTQKRLLTTCFLFDMTFKKFRLERIFFSFFFVLHEFNVSKRFSKLAFIEKLCNVQVWGSVLSRSLKIRGFSIGLHVGLYAFVHSLWTIDDDEEQKWTCLDISFINLL